MNMNVRNTILYTIVGLAMSASGIASASSIYHMAGGDVGFTTHLEHSQSTKTRNEVLQEVQVARQDGSLAFLQRGAPLPVKSSGTPATRQQVQQEILNMSTTEQKRLQDMYRN